MAQIGDYLKSVMKDVPLETTPGTDPGTYVHTYRLGDSSAEKLMERMLSSGKLTVTRDKTTLEATLKGSPEEVKRWAQAIAGAINALYDDSPDYSDSRYDI